MDSKTTAADGTLVGSESKSAPPTPDLMGVAGSPPPVAPPAPDAISVVAETPGKASPQDLQDAMEWFLADEGEEADPIYTIQINTSVDVDRPNWIKWSIKPMPSQRIDVLRRMFSMPLNREQRRAGVGTDLDAARFNAAIVFESTVYPDLSVPIAQGKFADGAQLILHRFRNKPLLVDQIAGQVLTLSGGDEGDLRTAREVRAAGN